MGTYKQIKKHKPRLNTQKKTLVLIGLYELVLVAVRMYSLNGRDHFNCSPLLLLMTGTTKQMEMERGWW